jgi:FAD/FMN-containing dehydrogenase
LIHYPMVIVFAQHTQDVVNALTWAQQNDVAFRVRSGRHQLWGWSAVDNGLVIDVSQLKSAQIDAASLTAKVGAGLTQVEAVTALAQQGLVIPTGDLASVGVIGATLGGGLGLFTRSLGMASDFVTGCRGLAALMGHLGVPAAMYRRPVGLLVASQSGIRRRGRSEGRRVEFVGLFLALFVLVPRCLSIVLVASLRRRRGRRGGCGVGRYRDGQGRATDGGEPDHEGGSGAGDAGLDHVSSISRSLVGWSRQESGPALNETSMVGNGRAVAEEANLVGAESVLMELENPVVSQ